MGDSTSVVFERDWFNKSAFKIVVTTKPGTKGGEKELEKQKNKKKIKKKKKKKKKKKNPFSRSMDCRHVLVAWGLYGAQWLSLPAPPM